MNEVNEDDLQQSYDWDSRNFGESAFLPDGDKHELLKRIIEHYRAKIQASAANQAKPQWLLRLGHLHLLALDWHLALSAYTKCMKLSKWEDQQFRVIKEPNKTILKPNKNAKSGKTLLLYGLGLCYFHFSNFLWAKKAFLEVLYREPEFYCAPEVHARLGLTLKYLGVHNWSLIHLNWALECASSNTDDFRGPMTIAEIKFHIGHVYELQQKYHDARRLYEQVLGDETKTSEIESATHTTLGWMLFQCQVLGENREERIRLAIRNLERATVIDPSNGQSWYYLGRCYSALRDVNAAFNNYRKSIDKSEACADTWCSIGVLYQEQRQFMDALQAFICAVQLDPDHQEAWKDLGVLYEGKGQYHDAFVCYRKSIQCKNGADEELSKRSKTLQESEPPHKTEAKLPSIEEAWTLPIPAELTQRQTARRANRRNIHQELLDYKKSSKESAPWELTQNEQRVVQHLQQSSHSLTLHQQAELERLQFGLFAADYKKAKIGEKEENRENNEEKMETDLFELCEPSADYGMEVSAIKGRRTPGLCSPTEFSHLITANELISTCLKLRQLLEKDTKLEIENKSSPFVPIVQKENFNPETPLVQIDSKKEASSKALADMCANYRIPTILIRGMCQALRLDLGFFSTKSFAQNAPDAKISLYTQSKSDRWHLDEKISQIRIRDYAEYQAAHFRGALRDETSKKSLERRSKVKGAKQLRAPVQMGVFELRDNQFQLNMAEIQKLPLFMKFYSVQNYLSYFEFNAMKIYFCVPQCRLRPRQHYFHRVSINVGPGDFEWFICPEWYWARLEQILLRHGNKSLHESWWPSLEIFQKYNIPVYRLVQKPGDILWIHSGSVAWGQALGWCNCVMYNVSHLTATSYQIAMENYERSLMYTRLPESPMMYISWKLCRMIRPGDFRLYSQLKFCLQRSIWSIQVQHDFINERKIDLLATAINTIHYCQSCRRELFMFIWVRRKSDNETKNDKKRRAYCQICALRSNRDVRKWCVLQQSSLDELHSSFNKFLFQKT